MRLPRNDLTALEGLPEELLDVVVSDIVAELLAHVQLPAENLLVGEAAVIEALALLTM